MRDARRVLLVAALGFLQLPPRARELRVHSNGSELTGASLGARSSNYAEEGVG